VARDWENSFGFWAKPPGQSEQERCENAERAVRNAISASEKLRRRNSKVFAQGSYRNNTNVRKESDVDIGVLCYDTFFMALPEGYTMKDFRIDPATYEYRQFKDEVGEALTAYFGKSSVSRGNKAFNIRENSYHVDADVAPFFEHRRYSTNGTYLSGVELSPDNDGRVINWPEQHYNNGVNKNTVTRRRFKALVRILKSLCNEMSDKGITEAKSILGFLVECLVWNIPDGSFGHDTWIADTRTCLAFLFNNTITDKECSEWGEVSELKYLFRLGQRWTRQQAHNFTSAAWDYVGFE
jgi:hypothetical protein